MYTKVLGSLPNVIGSLELQQPLRWLYVLPHKQFNLLYKSFIYLFVYLIYSCAMKLLKTKAGNEKHFRNYVKNLWAVKRSKSRSKKYVSDLDGKHLSKTLRTDSPSE